MIKRLNKKLRMAGLEDSLVAHLGLEPGSASWLARLGCDVAEKDGVELLEFRGPAQITQLLWQLDRAGYNELLDRMAAQAPVLGRSLESHRSTFAESAWRWAA
jgi:hypothetical protein